MTKSRKKFDAAFKAKIALEALNGDSTLPKHRVAQLNNGGVLCTMRYIMTTRGDGNMVTRRSVDCEESEPRFMPGRSRFSTRSNRLSDLLGVSGAITRLTRLPVRQWPLGVRACLTRWACS